MDAFTPNRTQPIRVERRSQPRNTFGNSPQSSPDNGRAIPAGQMLQTKAQYAGCTFTCPASDTDPKKRGFRFAKSTAWSKTQEEMRQLAKRQFNGHVDVTDDVPLDRLPSDARTMVEDWIYNKNALEKQPELYEWQVALIKEKTKGGGILSGSARKALDVIIKRVLRDDFRISPLRGGERRPSGGPRGVPRVHSTGDLRNAEHVPRHLNFDSMHGRAPHAPFFRDDMMGQPGLRGPMHGGPMPAGACMNVPRPDFPPPSNAAGRMPGPQPGIQIIHSGSEIDSESDGMNSPPRGVPNGPRPGMFHPPVQPHNAPVGGMPPPGQTHPNFGPRPGAAPMPHIHNLSGGNPHAPPQGQPTQRASGMAGGFPPQVHMPPMHGGVPPGAFPGNAHPPHAPVPPGVNPRDAGMRPPKNHQYPAPKHAGTGVNIPMQNVHVPPQGSHHHGPPKPNHHAKGPILHQDPIYSDDDSEAVTSISGDFTDITPGTPASFGEEVPRSKKYKFNGARHGNERVYRQHRRRRSSERERDHKENKDRRTSDHGFVVIDNPPRPKLQRMATSPVRNKPQMGAGPAGDVLRPRLESRGSLDYERERERERDRERQRQLELQVREAERDREKRAQYQAQKERQEREIEQVTQKLRAEELFAKERELDAMMKEKEEQRHQAKIEQINRRMDRLAAEEREDRLDNYARGSDSRYGNGAGSVTLRRDDLRRDDLRRGDYHRDDFRRDDFRLDDFRRDDIKWDDLRRDSPRRDTFRRDDIRRPDMRYDDLRERDLFRDHGFGTSFDDERRGGYGDGGSHVRQRDDDLPRNRGSYAHRSMYR